MSPMVGFKCPATLARVPFDHFDHCDHGLKGRTAFSPWLANAIRVGTEQDIRHAGVELTATGIMGCPRSTAIQAAVDYWLDPSQAEVRARGTSLHKIAAGWMNPEVWITEEDDPVKLELVGRLWPGVFPVDGNLVTEEGVRISQLIDAVRKDMTEILDWKFPKDSSAQFRAKDGSPKEGYEIQLNEARLLLAQQEWAIEAGYKVDEVKMTVFDGALGWKEGGKAQPCRYIGEMEMLELESAPGSGFRVGDVISIHLDMYKRWQAAGGNPEDLRRVAAETVCTKDAAFKGKGCTHYCDVYAESAQLYREFGKPEIAEEE